MEVARRPYKGFGPIDFFGLWDIIAYRLGKFLLVQVRSNEKGNIQPLRDFEVPAGVRKQIVVYKDFSRVNPWVEEL